MASPIDNRSLPELVRALADDAQELVRAEVSLAKVELENTLRILLITLVGTTAATVVTIEALCGFAAALALALGASPALALTSAAGLAATLVLAAALVSRRLIAKYQHKTKQQGETRGAVPHAAALPNTQSEVW